MSEIDNHVYEFGYILVPTVTEEHTASKVATLKEILSKYGASFIGEESPSFMHLAYPMYRVIANKKTKFADGYFGWVKFTTEPAMLKEIKAIFDRDEDILRYMLIGTVPENTLAPKKLTAKPERRKYQTASTSTEATAPVEEVAVVATEEVSPEAEEVETPLEA